MRKKLFTNYSKKIWKPCKSAKIVAKPCTIPKVATRLWARLTFVCGQDLRSFVGNTCMRLWGRLVFEWGIRNEELGMRSEVWGMECWIRPFLCHKYGSFVVVTGLLFMFDNKLSWIWVQVSLLFPDFSYLCPLKGI